MITTKITWTLEISRIVQKRCVACHASGSDVPLSTYEEARPWAKAIRDQVLARKMPPWGAVKGAGDFRDDPSLMPLEIEMITHWVEGGAPKGDEINLATAAVSSGPVKTRSCGSSLTIEPGSHAIRGRFRGLQAAQLPAGADLEAAAELPGGEVRRLIWIRDFPPPHARATQPYWFREPLDLPAGSQILVDALPPAKLLLCR